MFVGCVIVVVGTVVQATASGCESHFFHFFIFRNIFRCLEVTNFMNSGTVRRRKVYSWIRRGDRYWLRPGLCC